VDFGFLDFTTLEKRRHYCKQELLLNQRLCPSLYLGLVAVVEQDDILKLADSEKNSGGGEIVEYGVKMLRMPEDRMMINVIKAGQLVPEMIDSICDELVPFYEKADGGPRVKEFGTAQAVSVNILENFSQTEQFIDTGSINRNQFDLIEEFSKKFLANETLFNQRINDGRIRDCHGDLYSANICLADQVYIFDCIEFNKRFRYCDVASDIAFLAMDLDFHNMESMSEHFVKRFTGASRDEGLMMMLNFYKCYRAYVRGKINLFTAHALEVDKATKDNCLAMAGKYFQLAERYATS
jgi:aminoglycoside phosphotransferase family enzyme